MDESRKQFLDWFGEEFESINNSEELHAQAIKMIAWQSWVKSRTAIEIELAPANLLKCDGRDVVEILKYHGIKVKE